MAKRVLKLRHVLRHLWTNGRTTGKCKGDIIAATTDSKEPVNRRKDFQPCVEQITEGDVKTRLRHLEAELSSTLGSLRSNTVDLSEKVRIQINLEPTSHLISNF